MSYWYIEGEREHFCYAKTPTYLCPHREALSYDDPPTPSAAASAAAELLGADPVKFARMLRNGHSYTARARVDGKLTDRCSCCGARMRRIGFAAWREVPMDPDGSRARLANTLGFSSYERTGETLYFDTKREAAEWARENAKISRAASTEQAER